MTADEQLRGEADVQVRIWLSGVAFDYAASASAARTLLNDRKRTNWCSVQLMCATADNLRFLPRLPCERLFLAA
jgi:hypothetical protein